MITDNTTTFQKARDITKRYMDRMQNMTAMSVGHVCPPDLLPKVKELEDKLLQIESEFEDERTQIEFDFEN